MSPDNLASAITDNLKTGFIGQRVVYHPRVTSTMDVARQEAQRGAAGGTVILAGEQTEGRGRVKRLWLSPPGNVALSIILYPDISYLPYLVMLASLAVVHSIESVTDLKPQIKWPNDILISGKKVGGILTESQVKGSRVDYSIIGIGLNIELKPSDFSGISTTSTSLKEELGKNVSSADVVRHLLVAIERLYRQLPDGEAIYREWRDRLVTLGKRVYVESGDSVLEGMAESVDRNGALMLRHADSSFTRVVAGDITLRDK